ncbi:hypothetical protein PUN28_012553 [Cardiocondyla obscurior]|uniref:Uncharacterized protein n=1 Tax=Cardiocondyla obscurior TaxID=286306 RepID=A0AAW2FC78_9HYME
MRGYFDSVDEKKRREREREREREKKVCINRQHTLQSTRITQQLNPPTRITVFYGAKSFCIARTAVLNSSALTVRVPRFNLIDAPLHRPPSASRQKDSQRFNDRKCRRSSNGTRREECSLHRVRVEPDKRARHGCDRRTSGLSEMYSAGPRFLSFSPSLPWRPSAYNPPRGDRYYDRENATVPLAMFQTCENCNATVVSQYREIERGRTLRRSTLSALRKVRRKERLLHSP